MAAALRSRDDPTAFLQDRTLFGDLAAAFSATVSSRAFTEFTFQVAIRIQGSRFGAEASGVRRAAQWPAAA